MVKGYRQKSSIDYDEIIRIKTIRLFISIIVQNNWSIYQINIKSIFFNVFLKNEVYIEWPLDYIKMGHEKKVLKLKKVLYELKLGAWNIRIDTYFKQNG